MFERVARAVARAELLYGPESRAEKTAARFYEAMTTLDFLPNTPTLINAGRDLGQLSACFVLPVEDSIESIFNAVRDTALIHKSGGGTGFSFSRIRPANDIVRTTHGVSSGPISFMNVFDVATETIKQGGVRRGANMGVLSVDHPDILEFIEVKRRDPRRFPNFNLSVAVTDRFMEAVEKDLSYDLINPRTGRRTGKPRAVEVFDLMVAAAWECGDPGLLFVDLVNRTNPLPALGPIEATNPCGEQPLLPYESCNLGSINLARFVKGRGVDYDRLRETVALGVRFLDDVVDVNRYPLTQIETLSRRNRKIGLGVMGLADMFIRLGLPYDSEQALAICDELMSFIQKEAHATSAELARERGNFPNFEQSVYPKRGVEFLRNATVTTIAPTGSLSIIAGCSSGIEPLYALAYRRQLLDGDEYLEVNAAFKNDAVARGLWSDDLAADLSRVGSIRRLDGMPEDLKRLYVTAYDADPEWHLKIQAAFQVHTDNAVSKTVNLRQDVGPETIREVFLNAYRMGLKGVTVYRDRSKAGQVLSFGDLGGKKSYTNGLDQPACFKC
jgi:ribonucleoside-diphosphate reductase alpha chain